jgi:hypothetical protein
VSIEDELRSRAERAEASEAQLTARAEELAAALRLAVEMALKWGHAARVRGCPLCADRLVGGGCSDTCPRTVLASLLAPAAQESGEKTEPFDRGGTVTFIRDLPREPFDRDGAERVIPRKPAPPAPCGTCGGGGRLTPSGCIPSPNAQDNLLIPCPACTKCPTCLHAAHVAECRGGEFECACGKEPRP